MPAQMLEQRTLTHLRMLEAESIHILREVATEFSRPVMMYSIGKDSSVMLRLAQKAFYPAKPPFPLLHIDTSYKFREMIEFRDRLAAQIGMKLIVHTNRKALDDGANPFQLGTQRCCAQLKTGALLDALKEGGFDAAIGGARRDEEKSRAKERVYSFRDPLGQWDPKRQRPELWTLYNSRINKGEGSGYFHYRTGLRSISGNTSMPKTFLSFLSISPSLARWSCAGRHSSPQSTIPRSCLERFHRP